MKILVSCEFSGLVRDAFRARGHDALSCDLLPSERPGPHYQGDVRDILGHPWDMMLAFVSCTHLAASGARWWPEKRRDGRQQEGIDFFLLHWNQSHIPKICIENPVGIMSSVLRQPDQIIEPWMFGHGETKKTCLWLKGLSPLGPTQVVEGRNNRIHWMGESKARAKNRSRTYAGVAQAMAAQWG